MLCVNGTYDRGSVRMRGNYLADEIKREPQSDKSDEMKVVFAGSKTFQRT